MAAAGANIASISPLILSSPTPLAIASSLVNRPRAVSSSTSAISNTLPGRATDEDRAEPSAPPPTDPLLRHPERE